MNNNTRKINLKSLALLTLPILLASCGGGHDDSHHHAAKQLPAVAIQEASAEFTKVYLYSDTTGTVRSRNRAAIAPKVTGDIAEIFVVPGQFVKKDELLVKISALEISSKLQSAQASVDKTKRDLKREQDLLKSGASTSETVNDLKDQLKIAEAMAAEARTFLSYTEVKAPFDGVITRKHGNEGDLALPGNPLLEIEDLTALRVESNIPEALGIRLELGMQLDIQVAGSESPIPGVVEEIAPAADPVSRTFPVKISLPDSAKLKSGQFAKVRIPTEEIEAILVPVAAVSNWGQMQRVFVVTEDQHLKMRLVKTGVQYGDSVEILSGLNGTEKLAIRVDVPLLDGSPIKSAE